MLTALRVRNFALIEKLDLQFRPGFNVLTGETGAGKSIVIDAVEVVLGGRAYEEYIRSGEDEALLEAHFDLTDVPDSVKWVLIEEQLVETAHPDTVVLTRELSRSGRNYARINGRLVTAALLRSLADGLLDIHGQHEHQSLLRTETHLELLDHYCGPEAAGLREEIRNIFAGLRQVERELVELTGDERGRAQRRDLLEFQLEELEATQFVPGEDEDLLNERRRLANIERLAELSQEAYTLLQEGQPTSPPIAELLSEALERVEQLAALDPPGAGGLAEQLSSVAYQLDDLSRDLRDYAETCEYDPALLAEIESRLELLRTMKRKYGDSIDEIIEYRESVRSELDRLERSSELIEQLTERRTTMRQDLASVSLRLSELRRSTAPELSRAIEKELAELGMASAHVAIAVVQQPDPEHGLEVGGERVSFSGRGIDDVELLLSPNPGEPVKPLARIASGGELARVMLALKTISADLLVVPTLIFDEIDAGVGGKTLRSVAQKMAALSRTHQVICVTHQPVLASAADAHYFIEKVEKDGRTITTVELLKEEDRAQEIARMLGAGPEGIPLEHARELLQGGKQLRAAARSR